MTTPIPTSSALVARTARCCNPTCRVAVLASLTQIYLCISSYLPGFTVASSRTHSLFGG